MRGRTWTEQQLKDAVKGSRSVRQVLACLGLKQAGGNYAQIKKYLKEYKISTAHFKGMGWNKGMKMPFCPKMSLEEILVKGSDFQSYKLKNRLLRGGLKPEHCEECDWAMEAPGGRIPLELHHINGDPRDHRIENLKILCPNCHSLKLNYRGLNRKRAQVL